MKDVKIIGVTFDNKSFIGVCKCGAIIFFPKNKPLEVNCRCGLHYKATIEDIPRNDPSIV